MWLFARHQQLQPVAIRITEIDAMGIVGATVDFYAGVFQGRFDAGEIACGQSQRHVIDFAAGVDFFIVFDFENGDALITALEKTLPRAFVINLHAEEIYIESSSPSEIFDVKDHVIDTRNFQRGFHNSPPN
jgi:hypothetical protein